MDDQSNSRYSRTPEFPDLLKVCESLNKQGAAYVVIGGFAVILHGGVRATKDIDFLVESSVENVKKIKKALSVLPDNAASLIADDEVQKYQVVRVGDEVVIDLMESACGIRYEELKGQIKWQEIEGVKIPVASKEALIKMKETLRPLDQADAAFLRQLIAEESKTKDHPTGI